MTQQFDLNGADAAIDAAPPAVALAIFDRAGVAHRLPVRARRLLELAAACYAAARREGDERVDRAGRDLALAAPLPGCDPEDQAVVASALAFQREKLRPGREPAFLWLGEKDQRRALRLAAILRVAAVLDSPASLALIEADEAGTTIVVGGERAAKLVRRAEARAGMWRDEIGPLTVRVAGPGEVADVEAASREDGQRDDAAAVLPSLVVGQPIGGEPVAEAARQMLRRFFDKLLSREEDVLKAEDAEDVHQMRVATRRLRASLQVVEGVYDHELIRRYRRGLRQIAQSLGAVRDGDVFLEHVAAYRDSLPASERALLERLVYAVTDERARARKALVDELGSRRYGKFKRRFAEFLTTRGAGALPPPELGVTERVRDFAGSAIWRRYELWRAYEVALPQATSEALHQARIAGKRLRYTLEFFADALGPDVEQALAPLVDLQENLGALQDGVAARAHVAALGLADDPGAQQYLAAREIERGDLLAALPDLWGQVDSAAYRRQLFEMIIGL
ncbi:MAG: CHAD domain-containing protein [Kouleothrix sp.]|nr:CHAD domain-containing protein [Kouleothrix sp.]